MITTRLKNIYTCFPGGKHKVLTMSYDDGEPGTESWWNSSIHTR